MTKLIIGCGYLGKRVAALWQAEGHHVWAVTRQPSGLAESTAQALPGDVLDPQSLQSLPSADTVLHAVGWDRTSGASMRDVYVTGLANVLARLPPPKKFIYISSSSVYGQTGEEWVDEDSCTCPVEESGQIVLAAEDVLREQMPDAIMLRFAGIYGPGRLLRQKAISAGEPIAADGNRWLNLIHVDDGARAVLAADRYGRPGRVYNICSDHPIRRHAFFTELARQLGAPAPRFVQPPRGASVPHEKSNRRLCNQRMREELQVDLLYPGHEAGIRAALT